MRPAWEILPPEAFYIPFLTISLMGRLKIGYGIDAIGQIYFQPFGLYNADNPTYFSFNEATVSDIKHRNPALAKASFHTVRTAEPRPYLIINGTMIGPTALSPFHTEPVVNIQYTPIYVGVPHAMQVTYHAVARSAQQTLWTGGGFVEPFAYGGPASVEAPQNNLVRLPMPPPPWTLAHWRTLVV